MRKHLFTVFFLSLSFVAFGQKAMIRGRVFSDSAKNGVSDVTVSLINIKDSTVEDIRFTSDKGFFRLSNIATGEYNLLFSALNYTPYLMFVKVVATKNEYLFDSITLKYTIDTLQPVTVVGRKIPIVIRGDTTEFNAASFKVSANATVEELLKAVPTLQVERDGTVKAQGEIVTQIWVDGKPFFSGDPKTITQNLPADIIDKIQLIEAKPDKAKYTNVDDGKREKVLNLTIKKDKKKGVFGTAYLGYGEGDHYEAKLNTNYFKDERKLALIASGNNTSRTDYGGNDGFESSSYNTRNGITDDKQVKVNYNDQLGKKFTFHSGLALTQVQNTRDYVRNRQTFYADSSTWYYEGSANRYERKGVNLTAGFFFEMDTLTNINFSEAAGYNTTNSISNIIFNSTIPGVKKINEGDRSSVSNSSSPNFNGQLSVNRRLKKRGRNIFFNMMHNINGNASDYFNVSNNYFYPLSNPDYQQLLNQFSNSSYRYTNIVTSITYMEPVSKKSSLSLSYDYTYGMNNSIKEVHNFNNLTQFYDLLNDSLTNTFNNYNYTHNIGIQFSCRFKKSGFGVGLRLQDATTSGRSVSRYKDTLFGQHFRGVTPTANYNYNKKNSRVSVNYNFNIRPPQASQLQPVIDNSNPLYIRLGNPNLKYTSTHNVSFNLSFSQPKKEIFINANGNFAGIINQVTNSTRFDKTTGVQISQPINMNGGYYSNFNSSINMALKPGKQKNRFSIVLNVNGSINQNVGVFNDAKTVSRTNFINSYTNIMFNRDGWLIVSAGLSLGKQVSVYSQTNTRITNYNYGINTDLNLLPGKLTDIKLNYDFRKNAGQSIGFNRNIHMVNAEITQYFSIKKALWLKLKMFDLLKQNTNIIRYAGENYIEDNQSSVLTRFFLLSLNYRLSKFGSKPK